MGLDSRRGTCRPGDMQRPCATTEEVRTEAYNTFLPRPPGDADRPLLLLPRLALPTHPTNPRGVDPNTPATSGIISEGGPVSPAIRTETALRVVKRDKVAGIDEEADPERWLRRVVVAATSIPWAKTSSFYSQT